jgi:hypothetical protein
MFMRVLRAVAIGAIFVFIIACGGTYMDPGLLDTGGIILPVTPPPHDTDTEPVSPDGGNDARIGPRTPAADAAAQRLVDLLLSDVEFDFGQLNASNAAGIPIRFSCIVDTDESPTIEEIEASIKKGCGEWGLEGNKGIAFNGGIAVFIVTPYTGAATQGNVVAWAREQTNLKSLQNTYAPESDEYETLSQIIEDHCSGTSTGEKVRSVNRLLVGWYYYASVGPRNAYDCLNGAKINTTPEYGKLGTQCDGYARSMVALLRAWDVKARYISGYAHNYNGGPGGGAHAWVQVWDDSEWLMVDPTWTDPLVSDSSSGPIREGFVNWWMMIKTINGDRVITDQPGSQGPASPKFHNARF